MQEIYFFIWFGRFDLDGKMFIQWVILSEKERKKNSRGLFKEQATQFLLQ